MRTDVINLTYDIELGPGEKLSLPQGVIESIGPGRWRVTIEPVIPEPETVPLRDHSAFLNSYASEDEGLYDEYPAG